MLSSQNNSHKRLSECVFFFFFGLSSFTKIWCCCYVLPRLGWADPIWDETCSLEFSLKKQKNNNIPSELIHTHGQAQSVGLEDKHWGCTTVLIWKGTIGIFMYYNFKMCGCLVVSDLILMSLVDFQHVLIQKQIDFCDESSANILCLKSHQDPILKLTLLFDCHTKRKGNCSC